MVSARFLTWATTRPYNHFAMFGHRRAVKSLISGLIGGSLFLAWVSRVQDSETHDTRVAGSIQYRENYAASHDDDVHRLPPAAHSDEHHERH